VCDRIVLKRLLKPVKDFANTTNLSHGSTSLRPLIDSPTMSIPPHYFFVRIKDLRRFPSERLFFLVHLSIYHYTHHVFYNPGNTFVAGNLILVYRCYPMPTSVNTHLAYFLVDCISLPNGSFGYLLGWSIASPSPASNLSRSKRLSTFFTRPVADPLIPFMSH